jgi:hypothetical protein
MTEVPVILCDEWTPAQDFRVAAIDPSQTVVTLAR